MNIDIDLGRAFSFIFDDDEWVSKILIGGLLVIIPIIGALWVLGYMIDTGRNVLHDNPRPLPAINFGDQLGKGFSSLIISLVYAIPIFILICITFGIIVMVAGVSGGDESAAAGASIFMLACIYPLIFLLGLVVQVFVLAGYVRYIQTDSLSASLNFGFVWRMVRSSLKTWLLVLLLYLLASIIASAGSIALFIGMFFTLVFAQAFFGHVLGQVALQMPDEGIAMSSTL
jgi:hypothetical protein